jgi:hypothetical protein
VEGARIAREVCPIIEQSNCNPSTCYEMGPRMRERLEIVLSRYKTGVSQDIKFTLQAYDHLFPEAMAPSLRNGSPHRRRALSVSWPISKHRAPLLAPYYESIFTPGSWSFIVPKFPIPLILSTCFTNTTLTSVGQVQRLRLLRLASMVGSVGSKGTTMPASSWKRHRKNC